MSDIADFSNFTGPLSDSQTAALIGAGVDRAIVGAQTGLDGNNYTQQQIDACRNRGIVTVAIYEELYYDYVDADRMRHACTYPTRDGEVYIAFEQLPLPVDAGDLLYQAGQVIASTGKRPGVYTRKAIWDASGLGADPRFAAWPLWDAEYNGRDWPWEPYGPWGVCKYRQFSDAGLPGLNCDLSQDWAQPAPPVPNPPIPPSPPAPIPPAPGPTPTGGDMFTPHFGEDLFYQVPANQLIAGAVHPNVSFEGPLSGITDVELHVALTSGTVMVKHGGSPDSLTDKTGYAFSVPGTTLYGHGRVRLGPDGSYGLIPTGQARIAWIRISGYYS